MDLPDHFIFNCEYYKHNLKFGSVMDLTNEQKKVVFARASAQLLVQAGPGTGKTHCLLKRLEFLVEKEELEPGSDILVLSFSVAAVAEVKSRLKDAVEKESITEDLLRAQIRTFDSFASRFIIDVIGRESLTEGYEARIKKATELMMFNKKAMEELKRYRHVLVDEIQDLVGWRAAMTLQILQQIDCGFTLLGDSAQGIYDFQISDQPDAMTSIEFLSQVRECFPELDSSIKFQRNYRIRGNPELEKISEKGRNLILSNKPMAAAYLFYQYQFLESLGELSNPSVPHNFINNRSCFLCRDNGQIYRIASSLKSMDRPFRIQKRGDEKTVPSWIGWLFLGWSSSDIRKRDFITLFEERLGHGSMDSQEMWNLLLRIVRQRKNSRLLDLNLLRQVLKTGAVFPEAEVPEDHDIILSTIHQSKGREFDRVAVVVRDDQGIEEAIDSDEPIVDEKAEDETRVLFVGLTRAKKELYRLESGRRDELRRNKVKRWVERPFRHGKNGLWQPLKHLEVGLEEDIDIHSFVSQRKHGSIPNIYENQRIIQNLSYGDSVTLRFLTSENQIPIYDICVGEIEQQRSIGTTDQHFGRALCQSISGTRNRNVVKKVPHQITGLWISDIVTEIGDAGRQEVVPREFLTSCLWSGVRIMGLGYCEHWKEM